MFYKKDFTLRPVIHQDFDMLLTWRNHETVRHNMYTNHMITVDEHLQWFEKSLIAETCKIFILCYQCTPIGFCNLYNLNADHQTGTWTFYLGDIQNIPKGSGSVLGYLAMCYFFDILKYNKLYAEILSFNQKSYKMHQRLKWQTEGILKQHFKRDDHYHDIYLLAFFIQDWPKQRQLIENELFMQQDAL